MESRGPPPENSMPAANSQAAFQEDAAEGLDGGSFTAQKLQHASPKHLHITNRRYFIGPLPKGWAQSKRRHWYKSCLGIRDYSSRNQTFSAATTIDYQRQSTRFLGTPTTTKFKPSFPQPDDIGNETEDNTSSGPSAELTGPPGGTGEESQVAANPRIIRSIDVARSVQRQREDEHHPAAKRVRDQARPRNSPIATNASQVVRMSSDDNVPETYFTAPESESHADGPPDNALVKGKSKSQALHRPESGEFQHCSPLPDRNSYATTAGASTISAADGPMLEIGSQSSLIPQNERPSTVSRDNRALSRPQLQELQPQEPRGETDQTEAELASSQANHNKIGRVITDRVRFGVEESLENGQRHLQNQLSFFNNNRSNRRQKRQLRRSGEVLRAEKMLVRIDVTPQTVPSLYNDNASLKIETRPVENWREYLVVCRQGFDEQTPYLLQFYKTRVIPQVQGAKVKKKYEHEIRLGHGQANVNLFSSLDKTLVLWHPFKMNTTRIVIMRARAAAHSAEWYTFIRKALGWKQPSTLFVHAPDLDVSLVLQNPFMHLAKKQTDGTEGTTTDSVTEEYAVSSSIIRTCIETLSECVEWSQILDVWAKSEKMGLAWRRYDRLEWIQGGNEERMYGTMAMRTSHDLELRPKRHYPTTVALGTHDALTEEPSPVEGFLILLTSQQGTHKRWGREFSKRLYFYSEDQYLCFCKPNKASAPQAPKVIASRRIDGTTGLETTKGASVMYSVDPYPLEDDEISWLRGGNNRAYTRHRDQAAFAEYQRNTTNVSQAEGYINLCRVAKIRALSAIEGAEDQQNGNGIGGTQPQPQVPPRHSSFSGSIASMAGSNSTQAKLDRIFELVLDDGLVVRLRSYNKQTRDVWVERLNRLCAYWKARIKADITTLKIVRQSNLEKLEIDEEQEAIIGQFAQKWEVARAETSPDLYNVCGPSGCRAIKRSGHLYRKPRRRGSFSKCSVVLVEGQLLIFQGSLRTHSGKQIPHTYQTRQTVLDLRDCYIYSGIITSSDLIYHSQTFDNNHPSHNSTPRIYLSDGWTSADEDTATTFVVWNNTRKEFFRGEEESEGKGKTRKWRHVSRLGTSGRSIVFKARSRAERDLWVLAIETEIDRLQQQEDLRIISDK